MLGRRGKNRYRLAIKMAFPELKFDEDWVQGAHSRCDLTVTALIWHNTSKAGKREQRGYWQDNENCRKFLCELAAANGFDPLVPENWYNVTHEDVISFGVCELNRMCEAHSPKREGALSHDLGGDTD
jgi:hypothetical protein